MFDAAESVLAGKDIKLAWLPKKEILYGWFEVLIPFQKFSAVEAEPYWRDFLYTSKIGHQTLKTSRLRDNCEVYEEKMHVDLTRIGENAVEGSVFRAKDREILFTATELDELIKKDYIRLHPK